MNVSTHTGTCQACGHRQAVHVNTGKIAKHGYTTSYGYFNGTCGGSDHLPLELDTAVNVATVSAMQAYAVAEDAAAVAEITKVLVTVGRTTDSRGRRVDTTAWMDRAEYDTSRVRFASFDREVEMVRLRHQRTAEMVRAEAAQLDALRVRVFGQPLQARKVEAKIQREIFKTRREAYARIAELQIAGHKAQSRSAYNGYTVTYR